MASDVEDDDLQDLRRAALATLKPKAQPISSISNITRSYPEQNAPWLEFPVTGDIVPEYEYQPEPLPEPDFVPPPVNVSISPQGPRQHFPQPNFPQPNWPNAFNNMNVGQKMFRPRGFPNDRRPFNTRAQRRSFGDRGRGRFFGRSFLTGNNRGFSRGNNRGFSPGNNRDFSPGNNRGFSRGDNQGFSFGNNRGFSFGNNRGFSPDNNRGFFPRGRGQAASQPLQQFQPADNIDTAVGNLIVIQPQPKDVEDMKDSHADNVNNNAAPSTNHQVVSKPKLVLPQDKYHTSSSAATVTEVKSAEPAAPKPRDKFSRYNDSDSEEEDDWIDSLLADDDVAKADKLPEESGEAATEAINQQDSSEKDPEESSEVSYEVEIRKLEFSDNEEEEDKPKPMEYEAIGDSPVPSDDESIDLDALAGIDLEFSSSVEVTNVSVEKDVGSSDANASCQVSKTNTDERDLEFLAQQKAETGPNETDDKTSNLPSSSSSSSSTSSSSSSSSSESDSSCEDEDNDGKVGEDEQIKCLKNSPSSISSVHSVAGDTRLKQVNVLSATQEMAESPIQLKQTDDVSVKSPHHSTNTSKKSPMRQTESPSSHERSYKSSHRTSLSPERLKSSSQRSSWSPRRSKSPILPGTQYRSISPLIHLSPKRSPQQLPYRKSLSPRRSRSPRKLSRSPGGRNSPKYLSPHRRSPFSPLRRSPISPKWRSPFSPLSPRRRFSHSPQRRSPLSPKRRSPLSPKRRSPFSPIRRSPLSPKRRSLSPQRRSPLPLLNRPPLSPKWRSSLSPRRRTSLSPRRRSSLSPKNRSPLSQKRSLSPKHRSLLSPKRRSSLSPIRRSPISTKRKSVSPIRRSFSPKRRSLSPKRRSPMSPNRRSPQRMSSLSPRRRLSPVRRSPLFSARRTSLSPIRKSPLPSKRRSPFSPRRVSPLPRRSRSPRRRSPVHRPVSPQWKSSSPHKSNSPRQRSISPRRPNASRQVSLSPKKHSPLQSSSARRSPLPSRRRSRSPIRQQSSPSRTSSVHKRPGYFNHRDSNQDRQRYWGRDLQAGRHHDNKRLDRSKYNQGNRGKYSASGQSLDRANTAGHDSKYQPRIRERQDRKNTDLDKDGTGRERSSQQQDRQPLVKEVRSKEPPMPEIDLDKLTPEERAKIEARRKKFSSSEVKIDPAKTVSLKSIKERTKKRKRPQQESSKSNSESQNKDPVENEGGKVNKHNISRQQADSSSDEDDQKFALLEEDSENSDTGRNWKSEGKNKTKHAQLLQVPGRLHVSVDNISTTSAKFNTKREQKNGSYSKSHKERGFPDRMKERLLYSRARFQHRGDFVSDDDSSDDTVGQNTLTSSIVAKKPFIPDIPPEKLRIQIKVGPKEKKSKKAKAKADFSKVYSAASKRRRETDNDIKAVEEEPEVPIKKSKKKKKDKKKSKHKLVLPEHEEDPVTDAADSVEDLEPAVEIAAPVPRVSVLERLGKKVPFKPPKEKKKKKKSHTDEEPTDLDVKIQKIKEKNAAIARRQQEIELDKKKYG